MSNPYQRYVLRCYDGPRGCSLDGYVFRDEAHARAWLAQAFVTDEKYGVAIQTVRPGKRTCPACGYRGVKVLTTTTLTASAFLATEETLHAE